MLKNDDPNYHSKGCFLLSIGVFLFIVFGTIVGFIFKGEEFRRSFMSSDSEQINYGMLRVGFILIIITGIIFLINYNKKS